MTNEGEYYPLKSITNEDEIDENNIKYVGEGNIYDSKYCSLPSEYYLLEEKVIREYKKTYNTSYVVIDNVNYNNNVKIYYDNKEVYFSIMSTDGNKIKIDLKKEYLSDKLLFFIDTSTKYTINLYTDSNFTNLILSKMLDNEKISIPDKTWITENTTMTSYITSEKFDESDLTKLISEKINCSYKEKYVYKYKTTKEYYDDNYYLNIDGYIKDISDYKIYYKGEPIINTVEIIQEKIVEVPQVEYIYIEKEINKNDSSQQQLCQENIRTEKVVETKIKTIEKEVEKIPKVMYVIIFILLVIIIILIIKLYKKYVERSI